VTRRAFRPNARSVSVPVGVSDARSLATDCACSERKARLGPNSCCVRKIFLLTSALKCSGNPTFLSGMAGSSRCFLVDHLIVTRKQGVGRYQTDTLLALPNNVESQINEYALAFTTNISKFWRKAASARSSDELTPTTQRGKPTSVALMREIRGRKGFRDRGKAARDDRAVSDPMTTRPVARGQSIQKMSGNCCGRVWLWWRL